MKDLYSFHASEADLMNYYGKVADAYKKVFERCGLNALYTLAAGGEFTASNTHEFQVVSDVGEDTIFVCNKCNYAENDEVSKLKEGDKCPKCGGMIEKKKAVEVGNIFPLGTKYAKAFNLQFTNDKGEKELVHMGSYGIGVTRLMAVLVELFNDENGIIWPESAAPYKVHLLALNGADADKTYADLQKAGVEVLYDDREISAGQKFAEADLIGIPWRIVVSPKLGDKLEVKKRTGKEAEIITIKEVLTRIK